MKITCPVLSRFGGSIHEEVVLASKTSAALLGVGGPGRTSVPSYRTHVRSSLSLRALLPHHKITLILDLKLFEIRASTYIFLSDWLR